METFSHGLVLSSCGVIADFISRVLLLEYSSLRAEFPVFNSRSQAFFDQQVKQVCARSLATSCFGIGFVLLRELEKHGQKTTELQERGGCSGRTRLTLYRFNSFLCLANSVHETGV